MAQKATPDFFSQVFSNHVTTLEGLQLSLPDSIIVGTDNNHVVTIFATLPVPTVIDEYWEVFNHQMDVLFGEDLIDPMTGRLPNILRGKFGIEMIEVTEESDLHKNINQKCKEKKSPQSADVPASHVPPQRRVKISQRMDHVFLLIWVNSQMEGLLFEMFRKLLLSQEEHDVVPQIKYTYLCPYNSWDECEV
ncbi:hypothetical protein BDQ17DRAFT_1328255 [Cyathus striatus]|nr:hypothetical protein BDQ17DRAFT_1328255 [Cyathus striatus]